MCRHCGSALQSRTAHVAALPHWRCLQQSATSRLPCQSTKSSLHTLIDLLLLLPAGCPVAATRCILTLQHAGRPYCAHFRTCLSLCTQATSSSTAWRPACTTPRWAARRACMPSPAWAAPCGGARRRCCAGRTRRAPRSRCRSPSAVSSRRCCLCCPQPPLCTTVAVLRRPFPVTTLVRRGCRFWDACGRLRSRPDQSLQNSPCTPS